MSSLLLNVISTELLLIVSIYLLYLSSSKTIISNIIHVVLLLLGGIPLLYATIDQITNNYPDANIGLGFAFMNTWIFNGIALVVWIIKLIVIKNKS
ncbi:hypothetical protein [Shimazuella kribbensis]|uniref:hypothetical protein n=1 Tax=Shimazuella kribbensis TaxID=139808 RepID=UPI00041ED75B|nr:hypothetical protein [Shimazuella kribbensis]